MGRKKRKAPTEAAVVPENNVTATNEVENSPPPPVVPAPIESEEDATKQPAPQASSGYAMTSHSGDLVEEDIYVSDGSDDDDNEINPEMEIVLAGSRMGVMRRGLHHPALLQQNRQWVRSENKDESPQDGDAEQPTAEELEERRRQQEEEELAKLDPVQRAARLLAEKQRKLEEAKESARRLESEENAGRDPCLFSKRTAFDIRMDQIEDKPWVRGQGDLTDFFNYSLTEDDWLEYSQNQLQIRQELTDASRQRRQPDPAIVPVAPRAPQKQNPKVAVMSSSTDNEEGEDTSNGEPSIEDAPVIGPALVKPEGRADLGEGNRGVSTGVATAADSKESDVKHVGVGGAWGAGAAPGSVLARLIEEQEQNGGAATKAAVPVPPPPPPPPTHQQQHQPPPTSGQSWAPEAETSEVDHYHEESYRGEGRGQEAMGDVQDDRNQQWDGRKQDWRNRNDYDRGRYDDSRGYAQSFPPRRGGYAPSYGGRGRGGYTQRPYQPHSNVPHQQHWSGRGGRGGRGGNNDYHSRKRHREEYDSNEYRGR